MAVDEHPEDVNPLGESHDHFTKGERRAIRILSLALVLSVVAVPIVSVTASSPLGNVFLGLSPLLLTLVLEMAAVGNHYKRHVHWMILVLVHIFALGYLYSVNALLETPLNIGQSVSVSVLLSSFWTLLVFLADSEPGGHRRPPPAEFSVEKLPEFVQSIEDKVKGINFAIGRTYRNSNGGSAALRKRLRVPRDWYNEFHEASEEERLSRAKVLVKKIHDRLLLLDEEEKDVLKPDELKRLKNLERADDGSWTVLRVLAKNDSDPVESYWQSGVDFCEKVLEGLG